VLRAAREIETTQESIKDWLKLDEGDSGFQLLRKEEISAVIYIFLFIFIGTTYLSMYGSTVLMGLGRFFSFFI
jgi:hypothetical protein